MYHSDEREEWLVAPNISSKGGGRDILSDSDIKKREESPKKRTPLKLKGEIDDEDDEDDIEHEMLKLLTPNMKSIPRFKGTGRSTERKEVTKTMGFYDTVKEGDCLYIFNKYHVLPSYRISFKFDDDALNF